MRIASPIATIATILLLVAPLGAQEATPDEDESSNESSGEFSIEPFEIRIPDAVIADLEERIDRTRWPDQIEGSAWDYGTDMSYLRELVQYWRTDYDWRAEEAKLNAFDHFKTEIDGLNIHFIHQRSKEPNARALVITHGWPGSVYEFVKIIGPLTDPTAYGGRAEDAFHVICPSLPGFGFSDPPREPGYNFGRMGEIIAELMARLGYDRYGAQGGDWGSAISSWLGQNDAEHVMGIHLNFVMGGPPSAANPNEGLTPEEIERVRETRSFMTNERGYSQIQGSKPQTLSYGLNDSPVGLAAWIVEKFRTWSDCDGDVESSFTKDELLTNIMLYWTTQSIGSSTRVYYETNNAPIPGGRGRVTVPVGCAIFPKELVYAPRRWAETRYNITQWTEMPRGGHFAALEEPELLVEDIRSFFRSLR